MSTQEPGRLFQVSYVTRGIDEGSAHLTEAFGARRLTRFEDLQTPDGRPSAILNLSHFALGGTEVELMEPRLDRPDSIYLDALPGAGTPIALHHLGFLAGSRQEWRSFVDSAAERGVPVPVVAETPGVCYAFLDTRPECGHYTEVVHREPGIGPGGVRTDGA